jgi:hypothetical protein
MSQWPGGTLSVTPPLLHARRGDSFPGSTESAYRDSTARSPTRRALVIGERRADYRVLAARHPWVRLVVVFWIVTCGAVVALLA